MNDADQQPIGIADHDKIAIEVAQKCRGLDESGIVADCDQSIVCDLQHSFDEHQVNLNDE